MAFRALSNRRQFCVRLRLAHCQVRNTYVSDYYDMRVLATDLTVTPSPDNVRLIQDVYSNSVALLQPQSPANELLVLCAFTIEHTGTQAIDFPLLATAATYPFTYDDPEQLLLNWATAFVSDVAETGTRALLLAMTQYIRDSMQYQARAEEGVQTPYETLATGSGSCRDFATLMIEAVRQLGYAARFVSGYVYTPALDMGLANVVGAGATHAWLEVFLPGAGWVPFDPTNNVVGGSRAVPLRVARCRGNVDGQRGVAA